MSGTLHDRPASEAGGRPPGAPGSPKTDAPGPVPSKTRHSAIPPLRAELRAGLAPWAALSLAGTMLLSFGILSEKWQGSWGETQTQLHVGLALLAGPLAAALGCWQGGRERRSGAAEVRLSGARSPLAQFVMVALPLVAGVLTGYAITVAGTLLASLPYTSAGRPQFTPLLTQAVFLSAMTVFGMVVGRLVRWRLTAPALAICCYAALGVLSSAEGPVRHLSPATQFEVSATVPVWWQPWAMACWTGALGVTVVLVYAARRRELALLPLAAALLAAVPLTLAGDDLWRPDPLTQAQVCDDSTPRICVRADQRGMLPEVSDALSGVVARLEGVPGAPSAFVDIGREPRKGEVELPDLFLGQSVVRGKLAEPERFVWEAAASVAGRAQCDDEESAGAGNGVSAEESLRIEAAVLDWLASNELSKKRRASNAESAHRTRDADEIASARADARALERLTAMTDAERRAWLGRYFATEGSCDPGEVPKL